MNDRIAIDKWMEALVKESRGEKRSIFDIMDEDWKKKRSTYNSTASSLISKLGGGFSHRGFTKNNLLMIDYAIDNKIVTRYYFKIKNCDDYGGIVPKQEIKDGKLYITPWQNALAPE